MQTAAICLMVSPYSGAVNETYCICYHQALTHHKLKWEEAQLSEALQC